MCDPVFCSCALKPTDVNDAKALAGLTKGLNCYTDNKNVHSSISMDIRGGGKGF